MLSVPFEVPSTEFPIASFVDGRKLPKIQDPTLFADVEEREKKERQGTKY